MFRYKSIFRISIVIIALNGTHLFAQGTPSVEGDNWDMEKARNEYWYNIRTSGEEKDLAKIELNAYKAMRSMENRVAFKSLSNPAWIPIAGSQDGHNTGRVRDVTADPANPNVVYVATASGGVWKTPDINAVPIQWINLSDRLPTLMGGAIAFVPPNTLLLGTGEGEGDGYKWPPGQGLFQSTDGGNNWAQVSTVGGAYAQIVVDSLNPQIAYAAYNAAGYPSQTGGLLKSTDGGTTWQKLDKLSLAGPLSIAYNTHQPQVLVVSGFGSIMRSTDAGATWAKPTTGPTGSLGRISVANAPTDPNLYYASIGAGNNTNGVFMSTDAGQTWTKMTGATPPALLGSQAPWCNAITVRPTNGKQLFVAGLDMYLSADNGKTWSQVSTQANVPGNFPSNYVHADHHRIKFIGNTLYDCGDGGLAKATAGFTNWNTDINKGLATLQFVGVDADKNFTFVTGGCQDNSTNRALIGAPEFTQTRGGDGGRGWVSPDDGSIVYTTYVRTTFYQSGDSGKSFPGINLIEANAALFRIDELQQGHGEGSPFYPAYDVSTDGTIVAFGGNSHIWMSLSGGADNFSAVPPSKSTAIGAANVVHIFQGESQSSYMWAGAGNSVWRSVDQGNTWVNKSVGEVVMGITSNPNNHNEIFVVTQGSSSGGGTQATQKHFFKSEDGGATFTNPATNFPPIGCWSVAYNPKDGNIYVGTDKGVVYSFDGGVTWNPLMNGMPLAEVLSLKIKGQNYDKLLAGTYGRGMFWLDLSQLGVSSSNEKLPLSLDPLYPNPMTSSNGMIGFTLKDPGLATITLHDILGRELRILEKSYFDGGKHQTEFSTTGLAAGTYFIQLTENGKSVSQKVVVQ